MAFRIRRLVAGTTGLTFVLLLLGIYTAATGSGLACAQRWPFCDGAVFGLFPATWPSFVEWFHRLVAMVTGFAILGTTVAAWRRGADRHVRYVLAVAVALLPAQILLGAETVLTYTLWSRALHFVTALIILGALVAATAWTWRAPRRGWLAGALGVAVGFLTLALAFGPRGLLPWTPRVQAASYAAGLGGLGLLLAVGLWLPRANRLSTARWGSLAAAALVLPTLVVRRLVYTDLLPLADLAVTALAITLTLAAFVLVRRAETPTSPAGAVRSD